MAATVGGGAPDSRSLTDCLPTDYAADNGKTLKPLLAEWLFFFSLTGI